MHWRWVKAWGNKEARVQEDPCARKKYMVSWDYRGGGGTRQVIASPTLPEKSTAYICMSPVPVMCHCTALLGPPIGFWLGVPPGASVYLIRVPLGNGPKTVPLPLSTT